MTSKTRNNTKPSNQGNGTTSNHCRRRQSIERSEKTRAFNDIDGGHTQVSNAAQHEAFQYLCGAVISAFFRIYGDCNACRSAICSNIISQGFIERRKFDATSNLHQPSPQCIAFIQFIDNILHRHLAANIHKHRVRSLLTHIIDSELRATINSCREHTPLLRDFVIKKWIEKSIKIHCRDIETKNINKRRELRKRRKLMSTTIPQKKTKHVHRNPTIWIPIQLLWPVFLNPFLLSCKLHVFMQMFTALIQWFQSIYYLFCVSNV